MSIHEQERRHHIRVEDQVYFDFKIIEPGNYQSNRSIQEELLGKNSQRYLEITQHFQNIEYELSQVAQNLSRKDANLAHYLNLVNSKIDFLAKNFLLQDETKLKSVNLSLGGIAFKTIQKVKETSLVKLVIYVKPDMVPLLLDGVVIYSRYVEKYCYKTAIQFQNMTKGQEQLLATHIMQLESNFHVC